MRPLSFLCGSPLCAAPNHWFKCLLASWRFSNTVLFQATLHAPPPLRKKEGKVLWRKEERLKACQRVWNLICTHSWPLVNSPCPFLRFLFILLIFWLFSPQGPTHLQGAEGSSDKQENQSGFNVCWLLTTGSFPGPVFLNWMIPNCLSSQNHHSIFFTSFGNLFILPG